MKSGRPPSALQRRASPQFPLTFGLRERGSRLNSVYPAGLALRGFFSVLGGCGQAARPDFVACRVTGGANPKQSTRGHHPSRPGARLEVRTAADHLRLRGPDAGVPALRPQLGAGGTGSAATGSRRVLRPAAAEAPGAAGPGVPAPPRPSATRSLRAPPANPT